MLTRNHQLAQLSQHIFWYSPDGRTDRPILGVVVGRRKSLMIDAGASTEHAATFLTALDDAGIPAPAYLVLTHWHWDHIFGMSALNVPLIAQAGTAAQLAVLRTYTWDDDALDARVAAGVEIPFCQEMIKAELPSRRDIDLRSPDIVFSRELTINLGGISCELHHVGGDHASDSTIVYVPEDKVLFLGDCLYQCLHAPQPHYSAAKLLPLLDRLAAFDATHYVEAHNEIILTRQTYNAYTHALRTAAALVAQTGDDPARLAAHLKEQLPQMEPEEISELAILFSNGACAE